MWVVATILDNITLQHPGNFLVNQKKKERERERERERGEKLLCSQRFFSLRHVALY
jgi:hypothetical protein